MGESMYFKKKSSSLPATSVSKSVSWRRPFPEQKVDIQPQSDDQADQVDKQIYPRRPPSNAMSRLISSLDLPRAMKPIQTKLTVGAPGDKYEQEADQVASQVMSMGDRPQPVQREVAPEEEEEVQTKPLGTVQREEMPEEEEVQAKPIAATITPLVQREEMPEEEEVQAKPIASILQREEMPEEEEPVQTKPLGSIQREEIPQEEEQVQTKLSGDRLQREELPEEEEVQTRPLGNIQREEMPEEEEPVQMKSALQRSPSGNLQAGNAIESGLSQSKGGGSPLAEDTRSFMESRFNTDFSHVRVHTDSSAVQMNKDLSAQAFTHGSDVYFGAGKSPGQNDLTAHELTHVVQQTGAKTLQRKSTIALKSQKDGFQTKISAAAEGATIQRKSAPKSPQSDPGFQSVVKRTEAVAKQQKAHPPAKTKATEAQAAAVPPANEKESKAQDRQVQEMNQQQPGQFNTAAFKAALMEKINAATPQNLDQADKFKNSNQLGAVKGDLSSQVGNEKKQAAGPIEEKTKEPPKTGGIPDKAVTPLPPSPPGTPPADVGAGQAAPKPKDASEVSMQAGSQSLDQQMTDAKVTDEQLAKSNEPEFKTALGAKKEAQTDAAKAPGEYRQQEQATLAQAQTQAQTAVQPPLQGMQGQKAQVLSQVAGQQGTTKGQDEQKRSEIAGRIEGIYNNTKQKVETLLNSLDGEVNQEFDRGASTAKSQFDTYVDQEMKRFKDKRYSGVEGAVLWVRDLFLPLPDEVNQFYKVGRQKYIDSMTATIDRVANLVVTRLNAAKTEIAKGKQEIQKYVASLDPSLRQLGQDAAQTITGKFDQLEQSVDNKQGELIDSLAQKYNENLQALDADIEKRKAENQGWVNKAKEAIGGVIQTILELKNMLMGMLAKAAGAVEKIIKDPIAFLGNLVAGIKQGFMGFVGNIGNHLKKGLIGWLTGALSGAGLEMPKSFDLKGIFALVTGILGLTYQGMRDRIAGKVGEKKVSALEKGFDMFILWKNEGAAGLWKFIQDKLANLKEMVIGGIQSFVIDTIINAGVTWVLSLLNPASAFVRACKLIIDVIMFFVERGSQIAELVNAVLDSVGAIADGAIGVAAKLVEGALAKALPVVIGFLASLIGLGGISGKIRGLIEKARGLIDKAIDWVMSKAIAFVKKLGGKFGFGKKNKDKDKDLKSKGNVEKGLKQIHAEEAKYAQNGSLKKEDAQKVAGAVRRTNPIFKSITVSDANDKWKYDYVIQKATEDSSFRRAEADGSSDLSVPVAVGDKVRRRDKTWSNGEVASIEEKEVGGKKQTFVFILLRKARASGGSGPVKVGISAEQLAKNFATNSESLGMGGYAKGHSEEAPEHSEYEPKNRVETRIEGGSTHIKYETAGGAKFEAVISEDQMTHTITGTKLKLKRDLGIEGRGVTQDSPGFIANANLNRSHLIADLFLGSGYKNSANLVSASATFNNKEMGGIEDQIVRLIKINKAKEFNLSVTAKLGELRKGDIIQRILDKVPAEEKDVVKASVEQFANQHPTFRVILEVKYEVTLTNAETNEIISTPFPSIGPDKYLKI